MQWWGASFVHFLCILDGRRSVDSQRHCKQIVIKRIKIKYSCISNFVLTYGNFLIVFTKSWEFSFLHPITSSLIWTSTISTSLLSVRGWTVVEAFFGCIWGLSNPLRCLNFVLKEKFDGFGICSGISEEFEMLWLW